MIPFRVLQMAGKAAQQVDIFDTVAIRNSTPATASYTLNSTGQGSRSLGPGGSATWTWLLIGLNTDYQVRATYVSGDSPSGDALGSWLALSTARTWSLSAPSGGTKDGFITVEIRRVIDLVIIDTASIEISVG